MCIDIVNLTKDYNAEIHYFTYLFLKLSFFLEFAICEAQKSLSLHELITPDKASWYSAAHNSSIIHKI